jgi:hypothetical protein
MVMIGMRFQLKSNLLVEAGLFDTWFQLAKKVGGFFACIITGIIYDDADTVRGKKYFMFYWVV